MAPNIAALMWYVILVWIAYTISLVIMHIVGKYRPRDPNPQYNRFWSDADKEDNNCNLPPPGAP